MINDDPEAYREVLIENANLPVEIADTYPISTYPTVQLPTAAMVDPVLAWMEKNLSAIQETQVRSLGKKIPWRRE